MNRFVKQNLLLITVMSVSSVIIVALLVYSGIVYFQMSNCISETENLRTRIKELIRNSPAPVDGNKPLIQKDIDLYTKLNADMSRRIGNPYKEAADKFITVLMGVKKGESVDEARQKFVEEYNNTVGKETNLAAQGIALDVLRRKYRKTWEPALKVFVAAIAPLTQEPDLEANREDFAFYTIGIPRKMQRLSANVLTYSAKYQEKVQQILGQKITADAEAMGFSFIEDPNKTYASGEEGSTNKDPFPLDDIPLIVQHWDIIGDICKRISTVNIKTLNFFYIRGINKDNGSYGESFERRGNYTVSHYSFEVTASLDDIRSLAHAFRYNAQDKRVYVVRSVFLYSSALERASAKQLLEPVAAGAEAEKKDAQQASPRRGRRRGAVVEEVPQESAGDKEKELRAKWLEEFERREKNLPFYQRSGYGDVKLGGAKEFRAVFDIDYVQLAAQN